MRLSALMHTLRAARNPLGVGWLDFAGGGLKFRDQSIDLQRAINDAQRRGMQSMLSIHLGATEKHA